MLGRDAGFFRYAFEPVIAMFFSQIQPISSYFSSVNFAVLNSLKPSSGFFQMYSPISMISLERLSIAFSTLFFSSSFDTMMITQVTLNQRLFLSSPMLAGQ